MLFLRCQYGTSAARFGPEKQIMAVAMVYIKHEMTSLVSLKIETALLWASVNTYVVITGIMPSSNQL